MIEPGPYVIVPFLRPSAGGAATLWVRATHGATEVVATIVRGNGQVAARGGVGGERVVVGSHPVSCANLCPPNGDLFALAELGAAHLSSADETPLIVELRPTLAPGAAADTLPGALSTSHFFGDADVLAGSEFRLDATDPRERFAVLGNGGESELFVFVNDRQGPFIPPGGAARIEIPSPGGPLHLLIESGDAVLAYLGAPVHPAS